jgi:hypothetical protein
VGLFGFVLGLAFWQSAQIVPIAVPVIGWTIWRQPRCLRHLWLAIPLAALGSLPWTIWNAEHSWASLIVHSGKAAYEHSLRLFVSPLLPMMLGLRAPLSAQLLVPKVMAYLIFGGLLALFVYGALKARHRSASILYSVAAVFPFVWAISRKTSYLSADPMYLVVLTPVLTLLLAQAATKYLRAATLLVVVCVISIVTLHRMDVWRRAPHTRGLPAAPRDFSPLISTLDRLLLDHVYADYWIAYRLDFDTKERIIAAQNELTNVTFAHGQAIPSPDPHIRYKPYESEVRAARHGFVFFRQTIRSFPITTQLEHHGYRRYPVGPFVVYAPGGG